LTRKCIDLGLLITTFDDCADIYIVADLGNRGKRVQLKAACVGSVAMDADTFMRGKGGFLKYQPAFQIYKKIFMSDAFVAKHDEIAKIITRVIAMAGTSWHRIDSKDGFNAEFRKACKSHRGPNMIALVSGKESKDFGSSQVAD